MKRLLKNALFVLATLLVVPLLLIFFIQALLMDRNRAVMSCSQALALVPGITGQFLRRAFFHRVLAYCHPSVTIEFGTILSKAGARLGKNVYIGPMCHIGLVDIADDVLIGPGVHIPSGRLTHSITDMSVPIRDQGGRLETVRIGTGTWVGSAAIIMADVGSHSVIMAGSVVDGPVADQVIAGGVPGGLVHFRREQQDGFNQQNLSQSETCNSKHQ